MGRFRSRVRRLERETEGEITTLVCPECGAEFVAYGDVVVEFLAHEWKVESGGGSYRKTPEDVLRIYDHEHKASNFVEKSSGERFLGEFFSGMDLGVAPEDVDDLSE